MNLRTLLAGSVATGLLNGALGAQYWIPGVATNGVPALAAADAAVMFGAMAAASFGLNGRQLPPLKETALGSALYGAFVASGWRWGEWFGVNGDWLEPSAGGVNPSANPLIGAPTNAAAAFAALWLVNKFL